MLLGAGLARFARRGMTATELGIFDISDQGFERVGPPEPPALICTPYPYFCRLAIKRPAGRSVLIS